MKHKCGAKGCGQKGIWLWDEATGAYCDVHRCLIPRIAAHYDCVLRNVAYIGQVHEGRKRGKPRAWKEAVKRDGWQSQELQTETQQLPDLSPEQDGA